MFGVERFEHIKRKITQTEITINDIKMQSVPRRKKLSFFIKNGQLLLYREITAVCSDMHTKHINTTCRQNVQLLNVKLVVNIVTTGLQWVKALL